MNDTNWCEMCGERPKHIGELCQDCRLSLPDVLQERLVEVEAHADTLRHALIFIESFARETILQLEPDDVAAHNALTIIRLRIHETGILEKENQS